MNDLQAVLAPPYVQFEVAQLQALNTSSQTVPRFTHSSTKLQQHGGVSAKRWATIRERLPPHQHSNSSSTKARGSTLQDTPVLPRVGMK